MKEENSINQFSELIIFSKTVFKKISFVLFYLLSFTILLLFSFFEINNISNIPGIALGN